MERKLALILSLFVIGKVMKKRLRTFLWPGICRIKDEKYPHFDGSGGGVFVFFHFDGVLWGFWWVWFFFFFFFVVCCGGVGGVGFCLGVVVGLGGLVFVWFSPLRSWCLAMQAARVADTNALKCFSLKPTPGNLP